MRISSFLVLTGVLALVGCGGETAPPPAVDGGVPTDLGGGESDARVICTSDVDCNDGLFCNGREMCAPASSMADVRGCTPGDAPCSAAEMCDEMTNDCRTSCDDLDGDGHTAVGCGGDDCDDADATRYPGATEVCDADDEDCNDATFGFVDADMDGAGSISCCNGGACGVDCDDSNASIRPGIADGPTMNCNGVDDDCDGVADVACPCADGERRPCYSGPAGTRTTGVCVDGVSICAGGMLGSECIDDVLPASEICNALDDDCDGSTDEGVLPRYYRDVDGDGFGQTAMFVDDRCNPPAGYVAAAGDCDDTLPMVRPGAADFCNGVDDDCDGMTDEGAPQSTYYRDDDRDGYGDPSTAVMACSTPAGFAPASGDCDDTSAGISPVGVEVCDSAVPAVDEDCDTMRNEGCACVEGTSQPCGGGTPVQGACRVGVQRCIAGLWAGCTGNLDPGTLTETCNGVDDDCDGMADETLLAVSCQADADSDGYGAGAVLTTLCRDAARTMFGFCPSGYSNAGGDCNDANSATRPMGIELCDAGNVDDDCDGSNNEGCACANGAVQSCGGGGRAGVGICRSGTQRCVAGAWLSCEGNVEPTASETCNGLDDNCVGGIDEGVTISTYVDSDGDTYGAGAAIVACAASPGFAVRAGDCNDSNPAVRPMSAEACNGLDDDCDGMIDEALLAASCHTDADSDGHGAGAALTTLCRDPGRAAQNFCPVGYSNVATDCNDAQNAVRPGAAEACNGVDDDCDLATDEGVLLTFYRDADGDGFGAVGLPTQACAAPAGYVVLGTDCADGDASRNPAAAERCDAAMLNEDCDATSNEGCSCTDGASLACGTSSTGACRRGTQTCVSGAWTACAGNIEPGTETCNGVDDDCDGATDESLTATCYADADGDAYGTGVPQTLCRDAARPSFGTCPGGYTGTAGDCNDSNAMVRPLIAETCNGGDDDCDGAADEIFACSAGRTRTGTGTYGACVAAGSVSGIYTCRADCSAEVFTPTLSAETCNALDDDCDGARDETFACVQNSAGNGCTTSCGTPGVHTCSGACALGICTGTEMCNGCDDDGAGGADDTFTCVQNATEACMVTCGGVVVNGTRRCLGDCSGWSACSGAEVCNGCDDDHDGAVDETFACERGRLYSCVVPGCLTDGTQVCTNACALPGTCAASSESCNYCDDNRVNGLADDRSLATFDRNVTTACADMTLYGNAVCGTSTFSSYTGVRVVDGAAANQRGAAYANGVQRIGYGPVDVTAEIEGSIVPTSTLPGEGSALVLFLDGQGSGYLGNAGTELAVPTDRNGYAVEWRYYSGADPGLGMEGDVVTMRALRVAMADPIIGTAPASGTHLDQLRLGGIAQSLSLHIIPDDPTTVPDETDVEARALSFGPPYVIARCGPSSTACPIRLQVGDRIAWGVTATTSVMTYRSGAFLKLGAIAGDPPFTSVQVADTCPGL